MSRTANILCISTYFKGERFLQSCSDEGHHVYLLTKRKLKDEAWPWAAIKDVFYIDDWVDKHIRNGIAYHFRSIRFDAFVALDDFDVEKVADLREYFRIPGMGHTTARHFRDKLSMRLKAHESGIASPPFAALFHDDAIHAYADQVPPPWVVKPRDEASATGIKKVHSKDQLWDILHHQGDDRHRHLIEKFEPGDVYHVDSLVNEDKVIFVQVSRYLDTPMDVAQGGGIFKSMTIAKDSNDAKALEKINAKLLKSFGLKYGASHTEFIKSKATGEFLFLETASRVGGANLAEMVECASGINLWAEWARIESAKIDQKTYKLPKTSARYAGIIVSLSRYIYPDYSTFDLPEIVWKMKKPWHIGMIVASDSAEKVEAMLKSIEQRIATEFHASLPPPATLHT